MYNESYSLVLNEQGRSIIKLIEITNNLIEAALKVEISCKRKTFISNSQVKEILAAYYNFNSYSEYLEVEDLSKISINYKKMQDRIDSILLKNRTVIKCNDVYVDNRVISKNIAYMINDFILTSSKDSEIVLANDLLKYIQVRKYTAVAIKLFEETIDSHGSSLEGLLLDPKLTAFSPINCKKIIALSTLNNLLHVLDEKNNKKLKLSAFFGGTPRAKDYPFLQQHLSLLPISADIAELKLTGSNEVDLKIQSRLNSKFLNIRITDDTEVKMQNQYIINYDNHLDSIVQYADEYALKNSRFDAKQYFLEMLMHLPKINSLIGLPSDSFLLARPSQINEVAWRRNLVDYANVVITFFEIFVEKYTDLKLNKKYLNFSSHGLLILNDPNLMHGFVRICLSDDPNHQGQLNQYDFSLLANFIIGKMIVSYYEDKNTESVQGFGKAGIAHIHFASLRIVAIAQEFISNPKFSLVNIFYVNPKEFFVMNRLCS